eukprot:3808856-Ditylum_brightwellii.AAC.1
MEKCVDLHEKVVSASIAFFIASRPSHPTRPLSSPMYASCSFCGPGLTHIPEIVLWLYLGPCIEPVAILMPYLYKPLLMTMAVPSLIAKATYCPLSETCIDLVAQFLDSDPLMHNS